MILVLSNSIGYLFSTFYLPSLLQISSGGVLQRYLDKLKQKKRNRNRDLNSMGRHMSSSSFAPSNYYSHAHTGSIYLESELTDIAEYRRRTLSRCNSSFQSQSPGFISLYTNGPNGTSFVQIQNPNYLQIPNVRRPSTRKSSTQSRRESRRLSSNKKTLFEMAQAPNNNSNTNVEVRKLSYLKVGNKNSPTEPSTIMESN